MSFADRINISLDMHNSPLSNLIINFKLPTVSEVKKVCCYLTNENKLEKKTQIQFHMK